MSLTEDKLNRLLNELSFDANGLIPAIAQQFDSGEVLMMAWMNKEAVKATLTENRGVYWSRSRNSLWRKGESSGQIQQLKEFRWDCDRDTILLLVDQTGVACHTGRRNCFYFAIRGDEVTTISDVIIDPSSLYQA
ncbi:MAG: phosphoribosyl-AMP cyclohydrolase [Rhodospirillaceae bacterium]|nr:phosphoribosyl-AMP cyclohydrolase [Rhodospirillaceae bacterium]|tara:strand:- start:187 stop:591 length:405 start_codon:yes stop_codon:yes gene_type:complete